MAVSAARSVRSAIASATCSVSGKTCVFPFVELAIAPQFLRRVRFVTADVFFTGRVARPNVSRKKEPRTLSTRGAACGLWFEIAMASLADKYRNAPRAGARTKKRAGNTFPVDESNFLTRLALHQTLETRRCRAAAADVHHQSASDAHSSLRDFRFAVGRDGVAPARGPDCRSGRRLSPLMPSSSYELTTRILVSLAGPPGERVGKDILVLCAETALKVNIGPGAGSYHFSLLLSSLPRAAP